MFLIIIIIKKEVSDSYSTNLIYAYVVNVIITKNSFSQRYIYNQNLLLNVSIFFYVNIDFTNQIQLIFSPTY